MLEIQKTYFSSIIQYVNLKEYNSIDSNKIDKSIARYESIHTEDITQRLNSDGFVVIHFKENVDSERIGRYLNDLLKIPNSKQTYANSGIKISAEKDPKYFVNSNLAQPIHTDEGYTNKFPRYVALYCNQPAKNGGESILVKFQPLYNKLTKYYSIERLQKLFYKNSLLVKNKNGIESKALFIHLENDDIGISYSPILQKMWCSKEVFEIFDFITNYLHLHSNQLRLKLTWNEVLLLDNCKTLHGRTRFENDENRLLFRYWFKECQL